MGACIFNVFAGVYNPIVTDANGCSFTMPVIINDIVSPTIDSIITTGVICFGDANGTAEVFATGDSLAYLWKDDLGTPISNTTFVSGLTGGIYTVTVTDSNGCATSGIAVIFEPTPIASAILSSTPPSCFGTCDGDVAVMVGGGTTPYAYLWSSSGQTTATATGLCAGTQIVTITDANGCITTNSDSLIEPDLLEAIVATVTDVSCYEDADGAICLNVVGGTPFYSYLWSPAVGNSSCVTNLTVGNYNVAVFDRNGCIAVQVIIVNGPTQLVATGTGFPSTCGNNNGVFIVTPAEGTPLYTYLWNDPFAQTDSTATGLYAGSYNALITDANGCTFLYPFTVYDSSGPVIDFITTTEVQCSGDSSGTATVVTSGGTPPYTYLWNDPLGQTTAAATGLAGGIYTVVVTDSNECDVSQPVVVDEVPPLTLIATPDVTICFDDFTQISVTGNGGTTPYTYSWDNGLGSLQTYNVSPDSTTIYTVTITDENNCSVSGSITITVYPPLSVTVPDIAICDGDNAILTAAVTGGNGGPYSYIWNNDPTETDSTISVSLTADSTFIVIVSDGCSNDVTDSANVTVVPPPVVNFIATGGGCEPLLYFLSLQDTSGGTITAWSWDFGDGTFTDTGSGLITGISNTSGTYDNPTHTYSSAGVYNVTLTVFTIQGCSSTITKIGEINVYPKPNAEFVIEQNGVLLPGHPHVTTILTPVVDFIDLSFANIISWDWDFGNGNSAFIQDTNWVLGYGTITHEYTDTGTYIIKLTVTDINGCTAVHTDTLIIKGEYILFVPNAFTPNGDGDNDYFMPKGVGLNGDDFEMYIYDRWGDLIATVKGEFDNGDLTIGWDGRANEGKDIAQIDVYVWLIKTTDVNDESHEYVGHVTLLR